MSMLFVTTDPVVDKLVFKGWSKSIEIVEESFNIVSSFVFVDAVILTNLLKGRCH